MSYIRQKTTHGKTEIVVDLTDYKGDLKLHPSIVLTPEYFEIVDGEAPKEHTTLLYEPPPTVNEAIDIVKDKTEGAE